MLKALASQVAISLDNAHLYAGLKEAEEKTRQAERHRCQADRSRDFYRRLPGVR